MALPGTTEEHGHLCPSEKWAQLGESAIECIFSAALNGLSSQERLVLVIADLNIREGNSLQAYIKKHKSFAVPTYYFGISPDDVSREFVLEETLDTIAKGWLDNMLMVPGATPPNKEPPSDLLEVAPAKPQLQLLVWGEKKPGQGLAQIRVPKEVAQKWSLHPQFRETFNAFLEELIEEGALQEDRGGKREREECLSQAATNGEEEPAVAISPSKMPKLEPSRVTDLSDITSTLLADVALTSLKGAKALPTKVAAEFTFD